MLKTEKKSGLLVMSATHIGNIKDTPKRLSELLESADLLVFEERKPSTKILRNAQITRPYLLFNEHQQESTLVEVRSTLKAGGTVLYASDQGCPTLDDPGSKLVALAMNVGASLQVIPGPSALTAALSACPFQPHPFIYAGYFYHMCSKNYQCYSRCNY